jgi:serine/threonine protein kinase
MKVVHPSAVTMYDALRQDDDVWLIMEYVPSRNMAEFLYEYGTLTPGAGRLPGSGARCGTRPRHTTRV